MLVAALRDLQFRARRFGITVVGTALVFALTLVLAGLSSGFGVETEQTLDALPLDGWVVDESSRGPLITASPLPAETVDAVRASEGVTDAGGMALGRQTVDVGVLEDIIVFGAEPGRPGMPTADRGRSPEAAGELMVSSRLGLAVDDTLDLGSGEFEVVGIIDDSSILAGVSTAFVTMEDAQVLVFAGLPAVTSVAYQGVPADLPAGLRTATRQEANDELQRPVESAKAAVALVAVLLWLIAALIIGAVVYLSVLEREQDFAVFKATGWSNRSLLGGVAVQALVLALVAAGIGALLATLLAPVFPMRVEITTGSYLTLPVLAIVVGLLASMAGLRRITNVDPAAAFG